MIFLGSKSKLTGTLFIQIQSRRVEGNLPRVSMSHNQSCKPNSPRQNQCSLHKQLVNYILLVNYCNEMKRVCSNVLDKTKCVVTLHKLSLFCLSITKH